MHLRKLSYVAAAAAFVLAVAGCGGGSDSPGGGSAAPAAGGELLIWTGGGPGGEATKDLAAQFGQENGVKVTVQIIPKDMQTQFVTASQAVPKPCSNAR